MGFSTIQLIPGASAHRPTLSTFVGQDDSFLLEITESCDGTESGLKPIDLTPYTPLDSNPNDPACGYRDLPITRGVLITVRDFVGQSQAQYEASLEVIDPLNGIVAVHFDECSFSCPGLFLADITLIDEGRAEHTFVAYVEAVAKLNWRNNHEPITIAEVRLWARDNSVEDNFLLGEVEYKDAEIMAAIRMVVSIWNEEPPLLTSAMFTTASFPYRAKWMFATIALLQGIAAQWYIRNELHYQAEGITIADKDKGPAYTKMSADGLADFRNWSRSTKIQLNSNNGYGRVGTIRLP